MTMANRPLMVLHGILGDKKRIDKLLVNPRSDFQLQGSIVPSPRGQVGVGAGRGRDAF
jgi:hypothetical protein